MNNITGDIGDFFMAVHQDIRVAMPECNKIFLICFDKKGQFYHMWGKHELDAALMTEIARGMIAEGWDGESE